jgi:L-lactate dehydrogenase complex protein LldG
MSGPGDRDAILARIRTGLSGVPRHAGRAAVPPAAEGSVQDALPLLDQFSRASALVGVRVFTVRTTEDARARVEQILDAECTEEVVVSAAAAAAPWRVADGRPGPRRWFERSVDCHDSSDHVMSAGAGVTTADAAIADTGTLVVFASPVQHRLDSLVPPVHVALLRERDIVRGLADLFPALTAEGRFSQHAAITFITGPSRTADIELTLTIGVHGPGKVYVVVLQDDDVCE